MDRRQFIQSISAVALGSTIPSIGLTAASPENLTHSKPVETPAFKIINPTNEDINTKVGIIAIGGAASTLLNSTRNHLPLLERSIAIDINPFTLHRSGANEKILVGDGVNKTRNFRATQNAFSEVIPKMLDAVSDLHLVFIVAGLGGITGTALAPNVATVLNQHNIFNIGFGITPFEFEGLRRQQIGLAGLHALERRAGATFNFSNDTWAKKSGTHASLDEVLGNATTHFTDIYQGFIKPCADFSLVGVDFEDIRTVMSYTGSAGFGIGYSHDGSGLSAISEAIRQGNFQSNQLQNARGVAVVIEGKPSMLKMREINEVMNLVKERTDPDCSIIFSAHPSKELPADFRITLMTSGCFT